MISKSMEKALNEQINKELYSAYLYLAMAAYLENENLDGMAGFMKVQAMEEVGHARRFFDYINEQMGRVVLEAIGKPQSDYTGAPQIFTMALEHEKSVTSSIHNLVNLALGEKDHATKTFLDWFVSEQVEEEGAMDAIVKKLAMVGSSGQGLLMLDSLLGQRSPEKSDD